MGIFDTFWGNYKCDSCKTIFKFQEQTKDYENLLEDFYLGDYIDRENRNYFYDFEYECPKCKAINNISIAIRRGQYVDVISTEDSKITNILELDNIEDGFQRNRNYEKKCRDKFGPDERVNVDSFEQRHVSDYIDALGAKWFIKEVYTEQVKDGADDKLKREFFYNNNYVYRVSNGDCSRIIKMDKYMSRIHVRVYEDSIATGNEFNDSDNPNHYFVRNFCILKRLE